MSLKIYVLDVSEEFKPRTSKLKYPKHSDYIGIECEFYEWLIKQESLLTMDANEADWLYLPVFWTNYFINHDFARTGVPELQQMCSQVLEERNEKRTFTICQYDDGPLVNIGNTVKFLGSRTTKTDYDVPLLCSPHVIKRKTKKYLGSFVGRAMTHPIRRELQNAIRGKKNFLFLDGKWGERIFVNVLEKSYTCLCPRGYGGSSFRFFEAMQAGVVPIHIGDNDIRPFKNSIPWDDFSFYFSDSHVAISTIEAFPVDELAKMGQVAADIWDKYFRDGGWCKLVIEELGDLP